jgi:2-methylcitrate dehydratase PrpD
MGGLGAHAKRAAGHCHCSGGGPGLCASRRASHAQNAHRLVGQPFKIGGNPRVDAQFCAAWCVANALQRGRPQLAHFEPSQVADAALQPLLQRISVLADPALDARGHTAVDLAITTTDGRLLRAGLDTAPGYPGAALTEAQHQARFDDCLAYAAAASPRALAPGQAQALRAALADLGRLPDARQLATLLVA